MSDVLDKKVDNYVYAMIEKMSSSFPEFPTISLEKVCPYISEDKQMTTKIAQYFSDKLWSSINIDDLKAAFGVDYSGVFYFLGWEAITYFTPSIMKMSLQTYRQGDLISEVAETIFLIRINRDTNDDKLMSPKEWPSYFNTRQIMSILDYIYLMKLDPLDIYGATLCQQSTDPWIKALEQSQIW